MKIKPQSSRVTAEDVRAELSALGDAPVAAFLQGFFKTGAGGYGEGDLFRGVRVPIPRKLSVKYQDISFDENEILLRSPHHEDRMLALFILTRRFNKGDAATKKRIYQLYLRRTRFINNWDLVDVSAKEIVGAHLKGESRAPLRRLARSKNLWERRVAIMATFAFIKEGDFADTLEIARTLIDDPHDLIHKAVGWMLREIGRRDRKIEEAFLAAHCRRMPRVMLRYAIEKFSPRERARYLRGEV